MTVAMYEKIKGKVDNVRDSPVTSKQSKNKNKTRRRGKLVVNPMGPNGNKFYSPNLIFSCCLDWIVL